MENLRHAIREVTGVIRTPVGTPNNSSIHYASRPRSYTEICQLDCAILVGEDVGALDIAMDDTLVVEVEQTLENLRDEHGDEVLRELAKLLEDRVQRSILAEPAARLTRSS
jgi:hypothetical protein